MRNEGAGLERAATAMLRTLGAEKASLLLPQPVMASEQTGLGISVPAVNEVEMEPVLLQTTVNGASLLALATCSTVRRALRTAGAVDTIATLKRSMLRVAETRYRIVAVTVKHFGGAELMYELEIEA
ncbi:MAG TPA: hypothetical protein VM578_07050 [Candidatus Saccharimonadales bacterium]|nr:hypothetical protein [Candidatus Saccharimonadales bacterium]